MARILFVLVLVLQLYLTATASMRPAPETFISKFPIERAKASIVAVLINSPDGGQFGCTAGSVGKGFYLTANHCLEVGFVHDFTIVAQDRINDLAILSSTDIRPAFKLMPPRHGQEYLAIGYPTGLPTLFFVPALFQGQFAPPGMPVEQAVFFGNPLPGMSGGPIIDRNGNLASVILAGGNPASMVQDIGFGAPFIAIHQLIAKHVK